MSLLSIIRGFGEDAEEEADEAVADYMELITQARELRESGKLRDCSPMTNFNFLSRLKRFGFFALVLSPINLFSFRKRCCFLSILCVLLYFFVEGVYHHSETDDFFKKREKTYADELTEKQRTALEKMEKKVSKIERLRAEIKRIRY